MKRLMFASVVLAALAALAFAQDVLKVGEVSAAREPKGFVGRVKVDGQ